MTQTELINEVAKRLNWTEESVEELLDTLSATIGEQLASGNNVSIQDFGVFETEKISEHIIVSSESDDRHLMPPKIDASFVPASHLKEQFLKIMEE